MWPRPPGAGRSSPLHRTESSRPPMAAAPGGSRASVRSRRSARPAPAVGPPAELAESSEPSLPRRTGHPPTADSPRRRSFLSRSFPARPDRSSRERRAGSSAPIPGDAWKRLPGAPEAVEFYAITRASESASDLLVGSSGEIGRSFGLEGSWSWLPAPAVFGLTVDPAHPGSRLRGDAGLDHAHPGRRHHVGGVVGGPHAHVPAPARPRSGEGGHGLRRHRRLGRVSEHGPRPHMETLRARALPRDRALPRRRRRARRIASSPEPTAVSSRASRP